MGSSYAAAWTAFFVTNPVLGHGTVWHTLAYTLGPGTVATALITRSVRKLHRARPDRSFAVTKVNLADAFARFADHWTPKIVGDLNGQHVKLVKFAGAFVWHHHEHEDELFLVVRGRFRMEFRDRAVELAEGEFLVVPRGVEHRPVADEEVHVLLFEPATTVNTGSAGGERTVAELERLDFGR